MARDRRGPARSARDARAEQEHGRNADAIALAEDVETAQTAEIEKMRALLGS